MKEKIDEEIKKFTPYYYNFNDLAFNMLLNTLAYIPKDQREDYISKVDSLLESLQGKNISGQEMYDALKKDLKDFDNYNEEAQYAIRTLQWVRDEMEKELE